MKKLIYIALILLGVGFLSSCEKEGGGSGSLVGTWDITKYQACDKNGNVLDTATGSFGTFTFTDAVLTIQYEGESPVAQGYSYNKEKKWIVWGMINYIVQKQTSNELVIIDDASVYQKDDYYVLTLKKR